MIYLTVFPDIPIARQVLGFCYFTILFSLARSIALLMPVDLLLMNTVSYLEFRNRFTNAFNDNFE
jgi:hypothetical protein